MWQLGATRTAALTAYNAALYLTARLARRR